MSSFRLHPFTGVEFFNLIQGNLMSKTITFDGTQYALDNLSELARNQVINLRATEQEIARTQALLAMLQTARVAYTQVLKNELGKAAAN